MHGEIPIDQRLLLFRNPLKAKVDNDINAYCCSFVDVQQTDQQRLKKTVTVEPVLLLLTGKRTVGVVAGNGSLWHPLQKLYTHKNTVRGYDEGHEKSMFGPIFLPVMLIHALKKTLSTSIGIDGGASGSQFFVSIEAVQLLVPQ